MLQKKLPVGIESFVEIRQDNFYYVDKTALIEKLLENWGKANLFTRPRRFGKSLNMSMLKAFFEIGSDARLFDGLYIAQNKELCAKYLGKYPVIFISLKGVNADSFAKAKVMLAKIINEEARRFQFLLDSDKLTQIDKKLFQQFLQTDMSEEALAYSLRELTELLHKHYNQRVIVLIDEYDVPLVKASSYGFYDEMVMLVRNLFENVLKTNEYLYFSVLTGCMCVAKESIFTGLNNFKVYSLTNVAFDEYFGFTDAEVQTMLKYYGQEEKYPVVKDWYDGYRFGNVDVYCPWDVICYCEDCKDNKSLQPQNYWLHTSSNEIIERFIKNMGSSRQLTKVELEQLVNGESVQKKLNQELTYKDLYTSAENIWSTLFMTGYLTQRGEADGDRYNLVIPNLEIRNIITRNLLDLFQKQIVEHDGAKVNKFCNALLEGNAALAEAIFTAYMQKTISVRDTFVRKPTKENFYHGILLGILAYKAGWTVNSNKETGDGFSDILVRVDDADIGIVIEIKYAQEADLEATCQKALQQISNKHYADALLAAGVQHVLRYAIACNRKQCCIKLDTQGSANA